MKIGEQPSDLFASGKTSIGNELGISVQDLTEELAKRLAQLVDIKTDSKGNVQHLFKIPTRGLIGFRSFFLRITRGNGIMNFQPIESKPVEGKIKSTRSGAIISTETGMSTAYSIKTIQDRGELFIQPQTSIYEGMIIGKQNRSDDLSVNVCREKKLTNHRASSSDRPTPNNPAAVACFSFL